MGGCIGWVIMGAAIIFVMASLIRWFEQTMIAVDERDWTKLSILIALPFMVWRYRSNVSAGRPVPVPRHEPVRGFGGMPKGGLAGPPIEPELPMPPRSDQPPPGTPAEFLVKPTPPPPKPRTKPAVDPEKLAKLRQKMIDQGMIKPPEDPS